MNGDTQSGMKYDYIKAKDRVNRDNDRKVKFDNFLEELDTQHQFKDYYVYSDEFYDTDEEVYLGWQSVIMMSLLMKV